jgi:hypothetical protein
MSYRFTNTEKWTDSWFSGLSQIQMLLFLYLCDNCDIAGFIEINYKRWANDLNSSIDTIEGACKGLARGLIYSNTNDCIFIKNFIKHQKNLPLNENNKAHIGILKRFDLYKEKFNYQDYNELIEGACKGLPSPTGIGNGIGNGIGKGNGKLANHLFKNSPYYDFDLFKNEIGEKYIQYDLKYYYDSLKNYSESKGKMYIDWLAAGRNFILKDIKDGKAKLNGTKKIEEQNRPELKRLFS